MRPEVDSEGLCSGSDVASLSNGNDVLVMCVQGVLDGAFRFTWASACVRLSVVVWPLGCRVSTRLLNRGMASEGLNTARTPGRDGKTSDCHIAG